VPFYKNTYTALVSFNSVDDETFVVRYLEEEINEMIPGNKLIFYHLPWCNFYCNKHRTNSGFAIPNLQGYIRLPAIEQ
jgi:hypothetical protein